MALEAFKQSHPLTMGVELELQLVSLSDHDLTGASPDLLHLLERKPFPGHVTPEITESMIEINTDVHTKHGELLAQLHETRDTLVQAADKLNIGICGGGTHPFQKWRERRIFSKPRFKEVSALYGYLAKQFTIFGQHVHVGCPDADSAVSDGRLRRDLMERLGQVRIGRQPAADAHGEADLAAGRVARGRHADVVDFRIDTPRAAAGDRDLVLARQIVEIRVAVEQPCDFVHER